MVNVSVDFDPLWDRNVGIEPTIMAMADTGVKCYMVDLTATDRALPLSDREEIPYTRGVGIDGVDLKAFLDINTIFGVLRIAGGRGAIWEYDRDTNGIKKWQGGTEQSRVYARDLPIRLLVIGL